MDQAIPQIGSGSPPAPKAPAPALARASRSRATNGRLLPGDGRSAPARRFRDVVRAFAAELEAAGPISEADRSLIRRAAALTIQLEGLEASWAEAGGDIDPETLRTYQLAAGTLRRCLISLGLAQNARQPKPKGADLTEDMLRDLRGGR